MNFIILLKRVTFNVNSRIVKIKTADDTSSTDTNLIQGINWLIWKGMGGGGIKEKHISMRRIPLVLDVISNAEEGN